MTQTIGDDLDALRGAVNGAVISPHDAGYE